MMFKNVHRHATLMGVEERAGGALFRMKGLVELFSNKSTNVYD